MKRTLSLSALALATIASVATSELTDWAAAGLDPMPLQDGQLEISTDGTAGEGNLDWVLLTVSLQEPELSELARLSPQPMLELTIDDQDPETEALVFTQAIVEGEPVTVGGDVVELIDCADYPACTSSLSLTFDVTGEEGESLRRELEGDMTVYMMVESTPVAEGAGLIEEASLNWLSAE